MKNMLNTRYPVRMFNVSNKDEVEGRRSKGCTVYKYLPRRTDMIVLRHGKPHVSREPLPRQRNARINATRVNGGACVSKDEWISNWTKNVTDTGLEPMTDQGSEGGSWVR
jgi:hypothetical protein